MYITYDDYVHLYGSERLQQADFERVNIQTTRVLDTYTTGIDNYKKLKEAFPEDEDDAMMIKACACRIADIFYQFDVVENSALILHQYQETANGLKGKAISSVSAGNESMSFSSGGGGDTMIEKAASDLQYKAQLMTDVMRAYLSGVTDKNGVNLLYMGRYPKVG